MNPSEDTSDDKTRRAFLGSTATLGTLALAGCTSDSGSDAMTATEQGRRRRARRPKRRTRRPRSPNRLPTFRS
ncbi:hypothetical protein VB779_19105 [Haloarculaceae archaeon H-GB11]|nr:hypothetical protein [Haloarculaceae archaeon H-GB11]